MATFSDNFNRADGPLGASWTITEGSASVVSNACQASAQTTLVPNTYSEAGRQRVSYTFTKPPGLWSAARTYIKWSTALVRGYIVYFSPDDTGITVRIQEYNPPSHPELYNARTVLAHGNTMTFLAEWSGNNLSVSVDGTAITTVVASTWAANAECQVLLENAGVRMDDFNADAGISRSMIIYPDTVDTVSGMKLLQAVGTLTAWSVGPPASTTFSANHGTLAAQEIIDATHVNLYWLPANYLGWTTFSETEYDLTAQVYSDPSLPPGTGGGQLQTPEGAGIMNRSGAYCPTGEILTTCHELEGSAGVKILEGLGSLAYSLGGFAGQSAPSHLITSTLDLVYKGLNGSTDLGVGPWVPGYSEPLATTLKALKELWRDRPATGFYTVVSMLDELLDALSPTRTNTLDTLADDLGIDGQVLYVSILAAIRASRGDDVSTILGILTELGTIRSAHSYTLEDIMDAIAAIPTTDLSAVLDKLDAIQPDEADTLTTVQHQADAIKSETSSIWSSLSAMRTGSNYTVQSILDRLDDLEDKIDAIQTGGAPVWPGLANVTMGAPVALVDQLVLNGPMDGVVVAVTSPPVGLGQYRVGGRRLDYGQMRLAFESDNGDMEGWQYFGFEEAVYTPHAMAQAAKCRFQLLGGLGGTVTPWTRS